jgi:hypothetical protein
MGAAQSNFMIRLMTWLRPPVERFWTHRAAMVAAPSAKEIVMAKSRKQTNRKQRAAKEAGAKSEPRTRADSKQAKLVEMLKRSQGATIDEIASEFEWQKHTVRGAIAGALKKKLGLDVKSEKVEGRGRVYRIAG